VLRGGSWYSAGGVYYARASTRYDYFPGDQLDHYGVRCVVSAP
jgi:formylglycine-generating enzyme required for sulfatase activity